MKIAISVPCHSTAHIWFTQALANMVSRTIAQGLNGQRPMLHTSVIMSSDLAKSRNVLVRDALAAGADYMLWLDSDHIFPDWTLLRLLGIDLPIIGVTQPTRSKTPVPTAHQNDGAKVYTTPEMVKNKTVEQVGFIGLGVCLMDMKIIKQLEAQAAQEGRTLYPLFARTPTEDPDKSDGEDSFFCRRLHEAGIPIHVDHILSWETAHIASIPMTMADALKGRAAS